MQRFTTRFALCAAVLGFAACATAEAEPLPDEEKDKLVTATGKEDQLPVPPATPPQREHPRSTQGKEDREPVPSQLIRRKQPTEETDRLSPSTEDRLLPETPDPDRLVPDKP